MQIGMQIKVCNSCTFEKFTRDRNSIHAYFKIYTRPELNTYMFSKHTRGLARIRKIHVAKIPKVPLTSEHTPAIVRLLPVLRKGMHYIVHIHHEVLSGIVGECRVAKKVQ